MKTNHGKVIVLNNGGGSLAAIVDVFDGLFYNWHMYLSGGMITFESPPKATFSCKHLLYLSSDMWE